MAAERSSCPREQRAFAGGRWVAESLSAGTARSRKHTVCVQSGSPARVAWTRSQLLVRWVGGLGVRGSVKRGGSARDIAVVHVRHHVLHVHSGKEIYFIIYCISVYTRLPTSLVRIALIAFKVVNCIVQSIRYITIQLHIYPIHIHPTPSHTIILPIARFIQSQRGRTCLCTADTCAS